MDNFNFRRDGKSRELFDRTHHVAVSFATHCVSGSTGLGIRCSLWDIVDVLTGVHWLHNNAGSARRLIHRIFRLLEYGALAEDSRHVYVHDFTHLLVRLVEHFVSSVLHLRPLLLERLGGN